jgi:hypothetical protein
MIILLAKITSSQFGWMLTICQLDCLTGDYTYIHMIMHRYVYRLKIRLDIFMAGQKNCDGKNVFRFIKLEESMVGEDSKPEETCSELAGTHFTIEKIKFR